MGDDTARRQRPASARRRVAVTSLVRSLIVSVAIVGGYFVLPMTHFDGRSVVTLMGGVVVVGVLLAWQIRAIARSPYPRVRATGALATSLPLFFALFATAYYVMSVADPANFTEPLTRLDAAYFTVTVFATVGFGDIVATSEAARAVATVQMLGDLLIVGLAARALLNAVQTGLRRRGD